MLTRFSDALLASCVTAVMGTLAHLHIFIGRWRISEQISVIFGLAVHHNKFFGLDN